MTKPSKTRKTFTINTFAEHNYNYVHQSKTNQPPPPLRRNTQNLNHVCSHYLNLPNTSTNSKNFQENPHPPQDYSENYPFFQQNKNKQQTPYCTNYLTSATRHFCTIYLRISHTKTATISTLSKYEDLPTKSSRYAESATNAYTKLN